MNPPAPRPAFSVSNLVPSWDEPAATAPDDGGGRAALPGEQAAAAAVVEQIVHPPAPARPPRLIAPPEAFDAGQPTARSSSFSYGVLSDEEPTIAEDPTLEPDVDYDALQRRDIAKAILRDRLIRIAEQREHRSAYEIVFIMLAGAVAVLLAAPPLVQVLLAAHGVEA